MTYPVWLGATVAATSLAVAVASPASAAPSLFLVHYSDHEEQTLGNDACVPFPVSFTYDTWGTFHAVTHGDSPYYGANNFNEVGVYTNTENGKTLSFVSHGVDKDVHVTDDGTGVLTIEALEAGPVNYYGPDGSPLYREAGLFRFTVVIDTNGTPADPDDDEELSFTRTGYWGIDQASGRDFCADLAQYLG
jgi:hypothetical protein